MVALKTPPLHYFLFRKSIPELPNGVIEYMTLKNYLNNNLSEKVSFKVSFQINVSLSRAEITS